MYPLRTYAAMGTVIGLFVVTAGATDGVGFAVKGGGHWVEDPRKADESLEPAWSLEVESPRLWGSRFSVVAAFCGTHLDSVRTRDDWSAGGVDYDRSIKNEYGFDGARLAVRWRPWVAPGCQVYLTAGGGYYQYDRETITRVTATCIDPETEEFVNETSRSSRHDRRDHGLYPWAGAGIEWPIGEYGSLLGQSYLLLEGLYAVDDDFGGPMVFAGLRFRW
ncbi:MAG: hypothetical protein QM570_09690 [Planctomycetota bacterium]|jgi:hypothetical protein|nr:hypothetical protein [Planctomycetota bacterium]